MTKRLTKLTTSLSGMERNVERMSVDTLRREFAFASSSVAIGQPNSLLWCAALAEELRKRGVEP